MHVQTLWRKYQRGDGNYKGVEQHLSHTRRHVSSQHSVGSDHERTARIWKYAKGLQLYVHGGRQGCGLPFFPSRHVFRHDVVGDFDVPTRCAVSPHLELCVVEVLIQDRSASVRHMASLTLLFQE